MDRGYARGRTERKNNEEKRTEPQKKMWETIKYINIDLMGVSERGERERKRINI